MAGSKRGGERGATLMIIAFASGLTMIALGSVFLSGAEYAYELSTLREREARLLAAADAGLAEGLTALRRYGDRVERINVATERDGIEIKVTSDPGTPTTLHVQTSSGKRRLYLKRSLVAKVEVGAGGGGGEARILSVQRE